MKVTEIIDHTANVREIVLKLIEPQEFKFRAGQFVMLHVPQPAGKPALRAYSIASDDRQLDGFRLIFKYCAAPEGSGFPDGAASIYVWALKGGETLQFTGPFGKVFFQEPPTEQIVFLNTGSGVSQHLCYLLSKKEAHPHLKYRMLFGVRTRADMYAVDVLERLKSQLPDFQYDFVLSRPDADWKGKTGYVQNHLRELGYTQTPTTFYLCGNGGMIKETKAILEADGVEKTRVWSEAFD